MIDGWQWKGITCHCRRHRSTGIETIRSLPCLSARSLPELCGAAGRAVPFPCPASPGSCHQQLCRQPSGGSALTPSHQLPCTCMLRKAGGQILLSIVDIYTAEAAHACSTLHARVGMKRTTGRLDGTGNKHFPAHQCLCRQLHLMLERKPVHTRGGFGTNIRLSKCLLTTGCCWDPVESR